MSHVMSGAGRVKDDGHDADHIYEVKDAPSSYRITATEMRGLFRRASKEGKVGVLLVYFQNEGFTVECRLIPGGKELI